MPRTFFGPYDERNNTYAFENNANRGRFPMGHTLVLPDGRTYRFVLNDGTVEIAGNLYQSVASVADHNNTTADVVRAIDATLVSSTLGATAAAVDIYAEGIVHINDLTGEGYSYRIKRAMTEGVAHAAAATSSVLTVNLEPGEMLQVAIDTTTNVSYTRNRYHRALIHASPPTATLTGVSPGVAALDRYYWTQTKGEAAVLANLTLLAGLPVQADIAVDGAVESVKRRVRTGGTVTVSVSTVGVGQLTDQDGAVVSGMVSNVSTSVATTIDISGGIAFNSPQVGMCVKANASTDFALIDLDIR